MNRNVFINILAAALGAGLLGLLYRLATTGQHVHPGALLVFVGMLIVGGGLLYGGIADAIHHWGESRE